MAILSIPERYQLGVSMIRGLDIDTVRSLRLVLDKSAFTKDHQEARDIAATALSSIAQSSDSALDLRKIGEALISMYLVKSSRDLPLEEFVAGIADALEVLPDSSLRLSSEEKESFKQKLQILLGAEVFGVISKIDDLRTENERVFCHARIITDLRPVFGSNVQTGPTAILVTHTLKIAFHESGRKGDHKFYVSLDAEDLSDLKDVILRAEAKASTLRAVVDNKINLFGVPSHEE